jgi:hypothetical protein
VVADPGVHGGDEFVVSFPVFADDGGVGVIWREVGEFGGVLSFAGGEVFGDGFVFGSARDTAFVAAGEVEDREEGFLLIFAVFPGGLATAGVPGLFGVFELVVFF